MEKSQPMKPEDESSNTQNPTPDPTLEFLRENDLPINRENYLYVAYLGNPPKELDAEQEDALPWQVKSPAK